MVKKQQVVWMLKQDGEYLYSYSCATRREVIDECEWGFGADWNSLRKKGFSVVKVRLVEVK